MAADGDDTRSSCDSLLPAGTWLGTTVRLWCLLPGLAAAAECARELQGRMEYYVRPDQTSVPLWVSIPSRIKHSCHLESHSGKIGRLETVGG